MNSLKLLLLEVPEILSIGEDAEENRSFMKLMFETAPVGVLDQRMPGSFHISVKWPKRQEFELERFIRTWRGLHEAQFEDTKYRTHAALILVEVDENDTVVSFQNGIQVVPVSARSAKMILGESSKYYEYNFIGAYNHHAMATLSDIQSLWNRRTR